MTAAPNPPDIPSEQPAEGGAALMVSAHLMIPAGELRLRFVRSGGPGGQHVNKSSTQVELAFDVAASPSLTDEQRARILEKLAHIIDSRGVLHLASQGSRSQHRNREEVQERLRVLLKAALHVQRPRRATKPTAASHRERLEAKRQRSVIKRERQQRWDGAGN